MTQGNVIGGHKANLKNPNTSEESKQHSREVLEKETGSSNGEAHHSGSSENGGDAHHSDSSEGGEKNPNNVAGGLKAALKNPNVSEEKKEKVKERLEHMDQ